MTNQQFCYWLQGYFEISHSSDLTPEKILIINDVLLKIDEPLGFFTQWLANVFKYFATQAYNQELLNYFLPEISRRLNGIFYHVIDNSYDTLISQEESQQIHDGDIHDE